MGEELKFTVARTIKWNVIDRVMSQLLYAVTGVVLANTLTEEDFGLVGVVLVFQAFASLFVDSGFSSALIQRKSPTQLDYSTVLWFNIGAACVIYLILFIAAPFIADIFQDDARLIPLSRVMFLSFIINATAIVQTNKLMKKMDVKMVAVSNSLGLIVSAVVGIYMAVTGWGAWAIVWQTITLATVKSAVLWVTSGWLPSPVFSWRALESFFKVGSGLMFSSFLNTVFQNIYSFFIGYKVGFIPLGYYSQADKWSKMGIMSLSQMLTASFLPLLSQVQDDPERYARICGKTHRFTSYLLFPAMGLLMVMAAPVFHTLFGNKWDASIILFQILLLRGIFTVLSLLYNNYIISLGKSRLLVVTEVIRDSVAVAAIVITLPYIGISTPSNVVEGVEIFLWGQLAASIVTWMVALWFVIRVTRRSLAAYLSDMAPYVAQTVLLALPAVAMLKLDWHPLAICICQFLSFALLYLGVNHLMKSKIQQDALDYFRKRGK
ncbi:MAG: lipopolysaccharide biosynthesis protein [Duncaniella sp.]|nr:lipopolysaccharide biosynthesis protein [Duncaniella sp.]MDE7146539.1 lipopolysaccharide biosynthesis protein [Duncaniella sp.]